MPHPKRTLLLSRLRERGIGASVLQPLVFVQHFHLLWGLDLLRPRAKERLHAAVGLRDWEAAFDVVLDPKAFRRRYAWTLFWSITHASMRIAEMVCQSTHEPELNGAYLSEILNAIMAFPRTSGAHVAVVLGDHSALGNEARTGADFGLVLEIVHGGRQRHLVVLLQAKRATTRTTSVSREAGDSTQLDRLVTSGIGSYLFYHEHDDPTGIGPTMCDADAIRQTGFDRVDAVRQTDDFAARLAAAAHLIFDHPVPYALPGMGATGNGRHAALDLLFNPNVPGIRVNDVLVARVGEAKMSVADIVEFKRDWERRVEERRSAANDVAAHDVRNDEQQWEPPIRGG